MASKAATVDVRISRVARTAVAISKTSKIKTRSKVVSRAANRTHTNVRKYLGRISLCNLTPDKGPFGEIRVGLAIWSNGPGSSD